MFLRFLCLVRSLCHGWSFWGEAMEVVKFFELLLILLSFKHILRLCGQTAPENVLKPMVLFYVRRLLYVLLHQEP